MDSIFPRWITGLQEEGHTIKKQCTISRVNPCKTQVIANRLLNWYDVCQRNLLWREDRDPYKVWVSEIMLQQTRVEAVIPYYERFMQRFPSMEVLAGASEEEVLREWQGLGYYSRARNLHKGVREVMTEYGGVLPQTRQAVESIPGIGEYTAGALLSIVYDKPEPAVDANVLRVFSRLFAVRENIASTRGKKQITDLVRSVISQDRPGDFNQALMDLGASVCVSGIPRCEVCPLTECCAAHQLQCQHELPVKAKKRPPQPVSMLTTVVVWQGRYLIRKRPNQGLLAGMWEFPTREAPDVVDETVLAAFFSEFGQTAPPVYWQSLNYIFSHREWCITVYRSQITGHKAPVSDEGQWLTPLELDAAPMGGPHRKIAGWIQEGAKMCQISGDSE